MIRKTIDNPLRFDFGAVSEDDLRECAQERMATHDEIEFEGDGDVYRGLRAVTVTRLKTRTFRVNVTPMWPDEPIPWRVRCNVRCVPFTLELAGVEISGDDRLAIYDVQEGE